MRFKMENKITPVEVLLDRAEAYARTSIDLFKLKATDKIAALLSNLVVGLIMLVVVTLIFVSLNIGIALLIGDLLGKAWLGFIILSGIYTCIGIVIYFIRNRWIKRPIRDSIINQLLDDEHLDDDQLSK